MLLNALNIIETFGKPILQIWVAKNVYGLTVDGITMQIATEMGPRSG
jgi:hypothetical protein